MTAEDSKKPQAVKASETTHRIFQSFQFRLCSTNNRSIT